MRPRGGLNPEETPAQAEAQRPLRQLEALEAQLFALAAEALQAAHPRGLAARLREWLERGVRALSGGSLLAAFVETEKRATGSESVARLLGWLRVRAWRGGPWFLDDARCFRRDDEADDEDGADRASSAGKSEVERARQTLLENVPDRWVERLAPFDSLRGLRLSLMRVFEQFQSELVCRNLCLHALDLLVATLFPEIEVWSHLVEEAEESDEEE